MIRIIFSDEAQEIYDSLTSKTSKSEKMLFKAIDNKINLIKAHRFYGNPIAKKLIPKEYKIKYDITNLFRVELPLFWRMLYTLTNPDQIEIIAFVIDILDHKKYDKKFGYKKK